MTSDKDAIEAAADLSADKHIAQFPNATALAKANSAIAFRTGFLAGIAWRDQNPSEAVLGMVEALRMTICHLENLNVPHPHDCDLEAVLAAWEARK